MSQLISDQKIISEAACQSFEVKGFRFSGVKAGIKTSGELDLALVVADEPVTSAALFTRNLVRAHPVHIAEERVLPGHARAWLVNSGNANCANGPEGLKAALETTAKVAQLLNCSEDLVLPASTGVIGQVLDAQKVNDALPELIAQLKVNNALLFAEAIRTTDRFVKVRSTTRSRAGKTANFIAIGKGAGMFHPDLAPAGELPQASGEGFEELGTFEDMHATMLVYIFTDAACSSEDLKSALLTAGDETFNAATVDGDTSTNDSVFLAASGKSGLELDFEELREALTEICAPLARAMVLDGEGAEHAVDITVTGLSNDAEARDIARVIATSPLVKTALTGKDANWGRLLMAAGRAGIPFNPDHADVFVGGVCICRGGVPTDEKYDRAASAQMQAREYEIEVRLGSGDGRFTYVTSDLGHGYIDVNAGYRS